MSCRMMLFAMLVLGGFAGFAFGQESSPSDKKSPPLAETGPAPGKIDPPTDAEISAAIEKGIAFLLKVQNPNGSWGSAENTKDLNIYAPVPGSHHAFRSATTGLCVSALCETGGNSPAVQAAIDKSEAWMMENLPKLRRANGDAIYNVWGHAYCIDAFVHLHHRASGNQEKQTKLKELIAQQVNLLERYEFVNGGWGYYDFEVRTQKPGDSPNSFTTATVLAAFHNAESVGVKVPEKLVTRAMDSIRRQRKPDNSFAYGEYLKYVPQHPINLPGGSVGRTQACHYAYLLYGKPDEITSAAVRTWLDRLFARNLWLDIGRKRPIPHESWFAVAGYFFYYGHYYAALCIEKLPESEQPELRGRLAHVIVKLQEKDGSWWDYPLYNYHQQYGTGYALMTLHRCSSLPAK